MCVRRNIGRATRLEFSACDLRGVAWSARPGRAPLAISKLSVKSKGLLCADHGKQGEYRVKKVRVLPEPTLNVEERPEINSEFFVFYNKATGAAQFRAEALAGERDSVERAAGLLAIQCLVRGHDPENFVVLVPAADAMSARLVTRAKELLHEGRSIAGPAPLSPRQKEILQSVVRNQANKEIASRLNITVRTVKFHISSLLSKFDVRSRGELARKAASLLGLGDMQAASPEYAQAESRPPVRDLIANSDARAERNVSTLRFPSRARTA
jgi:DNA-binding CsgD family transcriptional regulator